MPLAGVVGEFFWDGAASTLFWVDPVNEICDYTDLASRKFIGSKIQRQLEFRFTSVFGHRSSNPLTKENSLTGRKAYIQNEITAVLLVQLFPYDGIGLHKKFKDAIYGKYQLAESK